MDVVQGKLLGSIVLNPNERRYKPLSELPSLVIEAFRRYAAIPDGVLHLEAFYDNASDRITLLEIQLRPPGADIRSAHKIYCNMDLEEIHFKLQMGLPIDSKADISGNYAMWMYFPTIDGVIDKLVLPSIKSKIHKLQYLVQSGEQTCLPRSLLMAKQTALKMVISNTNYEALVEDFEYLKKFQPFTLRK